MNAEDPGPGSKQTTRPIRWTKKTRLDDMRKEEGEEDRWTKKTMLDEMKGEEQEKENTKEDDKEEKHDKTRLSKLGRSVFQPAFQNSLNV